MSNREYKTSASRERTVEMAPADAGRDSTNDFTNMNDFYGVPGGPKTELYVNASLVLEKVDMPNEVFDVMCYIETWWKPAFPEDVLNLESGEGDDKKTGLDCIKFITAPWNWEDIFYNAVGEDTLTEASHQWLENKTVIWGVYHSRCTIPMNVDLTRFPFDRQTFDLRASIDTANYTVLQKRPSWVPKHSKGVTSLANNNDQIIQLRLGEMCEDSYRIKDPIFDCESNSQGVVLLRILIERRDEFYWSSVFYPMLTILVAGLPNVAVPIDGAGALADRLGLSGVMFLVVIAFRYTVQQLVPEISYSTVIDYYMSVATSASAMFIFENAIFGLVIEYSGKTMSVTDRTSLVDSCRYLDLTLHFVFGVFWITLHLLTNCFDNLFHDTWENTLARESGEEHWLPEGEGPTLLGSRYVDNSGEPRYKFYSHDIKSKSGKRRSRGASTNII